MKEFNFLLPPADGDSSMANFFLFFFPPVNVTFAAGQQRVLKVALAFCHRWHEVKLSHAVGGCSRSGGRKSTNLRFKFWRMWTRRDSQRADGWKGPDKRCEKGPGPPIFSEIIEHLKRSTWSYTPSAITAFSCGWYNGAAVEQRLPVGAAASPEIIGFAFFFFCMVVVVF